MARLGSKQTSKQRDFAEQSVALGRAGITVFRDTTFLAAGPASERSRSASGRAKKDSERVTFLLPPGLRTRRGGYTSTNCSGVNENSPSFIVNRSETDKGRAT